MGKVALDAPKTQNCVVFQNPSDGSSSTVRTAAVRSSVCGVLTGGDNGGLYLWQGGTYVNDRHFLSYKDNLLFFNLCINVYFDSIIQIDIDFILFLFVLCLFFCLNFVLLLFHIVLCKFHFGVLFNSSSFYLDYSLIGV